ncbi:hypothetical protein KP509_10G078500 [Ceratopteris richardii]|uniref:Uncharacterized protein n=1 Tax=Ceratopteris richardii TaxID=49495 RepID=A0A8T2U0L4_CERRI|nr:hypothetical protein KP509_10G078500 [Ceratopteris richardii]
MADSVFSLPGNLSFSIGISDSAAAADKKKLSKNAKKQRLPIKRSFWESTGHSAKIASRASIRIRSAALRQGKFAEARSLSGAPDVPEN